MGIDIQRNNPTTVSEAPPPVDTPPEPDVSSPPQTPLEPKDEFTGDAPPASDPGASLLLQLAGEGANPFGVGEEPVEADADTADAGLVPATEVSGLNEGQLGNFNATVDAVNTSGLEGEDADRALLVLTAAGLQSNFSNQTGRPDQLRDGTSGLFNLPEQNSMGALSTDERNDVGTALDGLLDTERPGSLGNLMNQPEPPGLGELSDQLGIASDNRAKMTEAVDFLAETGSVSPERIAGLREIVAADDTLEDKSWEVASFSTNPDETYDYWANDYSPRTSMGFDGWRASRQDYHNGLDLMGGNETVQSGFGNGTVVTTEAWGTGTHDPGSGGNSNAVRVEYELPNSDETFLVDYGHLQNNSTLEVAEGDTIEAGQSLGLTSFDDNWSNGGHLDLKIRIPDSLTSEFEPGDTRSTRNDRSFVDVQAFMQWYTEQVDGH